ncbi:hypothetical protein ONS96_004728 [Cadophora gregata f. sp. sojae]|nr:hypothetical protein ONS96_004728 [Cadophora gregata f. sp. sojae]
MVGISQVTMSRGALALATLSMVAAQAQFQQPNMRALQNSSPLLARELLVPGIDTKSPNSLTNSTHTLHHRGVSSSAHGFDTKSGITKGHRQGSLDENGENPVDKMGYDTQAKKEYWEGKYKRFNSKKPSTSSSKGPANDVPPQGTVSDLRDKWENDIPGNVNSAADSRRGSNPMDNHGDIRDMWENNIPSSQRPGSKPDTPPAPEAPGENKLDDASTNSEGDLNDLTGEQRAKVSDLKKKFENMGSSSNPAPAPARPDPQAQPPSSPDQPADPMRPADLPKPGTVQDLKNRCENSGVDDAIPPKAPSTPEPNPAPNPKAVSDPSPPSDPVSPPTAQEPSIVDQLREFSSFDANGKSISPLVSPKSGSPPPKRPLHEKINKWEKASNKDAKKRPEAKYELEDPALHPKPPRPEIPKDAGVDVDAAVQRGMDAARSRNPEIKRIDKSINDLVKSMEHNAAYRGLGDQQIAKIKNMQARRDAEEKEMLKQKADLANKRKHLEDERTRLGTDKSEHQEDLAQEALEEFLDLFKQYNAGIDSMYQTIDDIKRLVDETAEMAKISEANAAAAKELEKSIMDDRARRAAERAAHNARLGRPNKVKPIDIPPIIQSFNVDGGKISNVKTNVPPPNVPLPEPLPGSLIKVDDPMRLALDDIRVKGKLTQETADKLVEAGWGITPQAEQVLKNYNIPVDNMARAKGAIAGFASTAHLAPVGVLASAPEALELAALAGSPEILAAVGVGMAAPEIAKVVTTALPVVGTATEQALQQGVVAAQVAGVAGKETFSLLTSGTTAVAKSSYAILAAGTGALGAGLGLIGGFIGGLFARKHSKDDVKHAVHSVITTQIHTAVPTKTVMEHITETLEGKTVTVEKTKTPELTTKSLKSNSEKSAKPSHIKTSASNADTTSSHSPKSSEIMRSGSGHSSMAVPTTKEHGRGPIIVPPVIVPIKGGHKTKTLSYSNSTTSHSASKISVSSSTKPVQLTIFNVPTMSPTLNHPVSSHRPVIAPYPRLNGTHSPGGGHHVTTPVALLPSKVNVTRPSRTMSTSVASFAAPHHLTNVTKPFRNLRNDTSPIVLTPYPMPNVTKSAENMTNGTSRALVSSPTQIPPYPTINVTNVTGNLSTSVAPLGTSESRSRTSVFPPFSTTNVTSTAGSLSTSGASSNSPESWSKTSMPPPHPVANVTIRAGNMTTASPTLVLTPAQVAEITSGALNWQNISSSSMPPSHNVTLPLLTLPSPTKTRPWSNSTLAMFPTTFETSVKSTSSNVPKRANSTISDFSLLPTSLASAPVLELAHETAVPEVTEEEKEIPEMSRGFNLTSSANSTMGRSLPFSRRS